MKFTLVAENNTLYSAKRFFEEAEKLGLESSWINPFDTSISLPRRNVRDLENTFTLHRCTGIRYDDYDLTLARDLSLRGAKIFNPIETLHKLRDKELQALFFAENNIEHLPTFSFRGRPNDETLDLIDESFGTYGSGRYVLKVVRGNKGIGVNYLPDRLSLSTILETFWAIKDQRFILQPYIEFCSEYRILIVDGEITGAILKKAHENDFRKNAGRGDGESINKSQIPSNVKEMALKAYYASGALYAGVDIMVFDGKASLLEFNLVPGFEMMEEMTNTNQAELILKAAIKHTK